MLQCIYIIVCVFIMLHKVQTLWFFQSVSKTHSEIFRVFGLNKIPLLFSPSNPHNIILSAAALRLSLKGFYSAGTLSIWKFSVKEKFSDDSPLGLILAIEKCFLTFQISYISPNISPKSQKFLSLFLFSPV